VTDSLEFSTRDWVHLLSKGISSTWGADVAQHSCSGARGADKRRQGLRQQALAEGALQQRQRLLP